MFPHSMKGFLFYETFPNSMTLTPSLGQHSNAPWRRQPTFREGLRDWDLGVQLEALETTLWKKVRQQHVEVGVGGGGGGGDLLRQSPGPGCLPRAASWAPAPPSSRQPCEVEGC